MRNTILKPMATTRSRRIFVRASVILTAAIGFARVVSAQPQIVTNWAAFNDHRPTEGVTHANATTNDMRITGNGGILKDFFTGEDLPIQLIVEHTGAAPDDFGANAYPDAESPAFKLFDGIVDVGNSGTPGVRSSAGTVLSLIFTNLDPAKKYIFKGTSARGNNYLDRWAVFTISGAATFTDAHVLGDPNNPNNTGDPSSPNLITKATFSTATLTNGQVALDSGENRLGSLVGWDNIDPGPDGVFSVLAAQYVGPTPFGNAAAGPYGYGFTAIYLAETEVAGPVRITKSPTNVAVTAGVTVTFSVTAQSALAISYQWQKANAGTTEFTPIAGATSASYTTPATTAADNGARFRCVASVTGGSATSREATLTVDTTPPSVARTRGSETFDRIFVIFSEPVTAATAGVMGNYSLGGGLTISNVTVVNATTVRLLTSRQTEGATYALTVSNVRDVLGNTIAANAQATVKSFVLSAGFATWHRWQNQAGDTANIDTFAANLLDPNFRDPDFVGVSPYLGSPRGVSDNYGVKAFGYFIPPQTGNYVFFMACDDLGYLFLSPDENPENKKRIASQPAWSDQNQWIDPDAISTPEVRSDSYSASEWATPNVINLTSGRRYYIELDFQEGTGGDGSEVYYKLEAGADPVNGTAPNTIGSVIGTFADPAAATFSIAQQPQNLRTPANTTATFSVGVSLDPTNTVVLYQWQRANPASSNFADIADATSASHTTGFLSTTDNGARYRVVMTVAGQPPVTSNEAVLEVFSDTAPPTVTGAAGSPAQGAVSVTVKFSEPVSGTTATNLANYQIAPQAGGANLILTRAILTNQTDVILTANAPTNALAFILTVNNVTDLAGNQIQAGTQAGIALSVSLIVIDDVTMWRYDRSGLDLGTAWRDRNYNDSAWPQGAALIADEPDPTVEPIRTPISRFNDASEYVSTFYFRTRFNFSGGPAGVQLRLRHVVDDGALFYLNGSEVHRFGYAQGLTVLFNNNSATSHEENYEGPFDVPATNLVTGENVFAVEVHQSGTGSSDTVFGAELVAIITGDTGTTEQPVLTISRNGINVVISWTEGGTLQTATVVDGSWADLTGTASPATIPIGTATRFYRVRR